MKHLYDRLQVLEHSGQELDREQRLKAMERPLLAWYETHARVLPWREQPEPYRVWISEIMLQQTRVEAVKPYFARFMEALPTVRDLAEVPEENLLKLWEGLGYYNRARNLQKAARVIQEQYGGVIPSSYEELLKLPGIGSYTAGAIASIAYGIPVPAVDGNVLRVISRVLASSEDILKQSVKKQMEESLKAVMPADRASAYNQGLIEIGAIICVPNGQPKCGECPLASICLGRNQGLLDSIPYKTPKKPRKIENRTILLIESDGAYMIRKRPEQGLLASLYEFPSLDGHLGTEEVRKELEQSEPFAGLVSHITAIEPLMAAKHIFSHVEWHMVGYRIRLDGVRPDQWLMAEVEDLKETYPIPNAFFAYSKWIFEKS